VTGTTDLVEPIERVYTQRYVAFCRLAMSVTGNVESAHDAVQEGFARALAHHDDFRGEGPLEAWLWRIVLRAALDARRRPSPLPADETVADLWIPDLPHPERDPELDAALRSLPARQRLIVFLRYFADLPHGEIAAICGLQRGTVSASLAQAKAALAQRLHVNTPADKEVQP
jgi:RNA polymerase sigma-70 factor (ECF subfamily)